jgi:WD40 repeat protein
LGTLALSPDGKYLAAGTRQWQEDCRVTLWDISAGLSEPHGLWTNRVDKCPRFLKFSPDGQTLIADSENSQAGTLGAWDLSGRRLPPFPKQTVGFILDVAFSPDGKLLATSGVESKIKILNYTNRTIQCELVGHLGHVTSLAFSPDGQRLISGSVDSTVRLWDVTKHKPIGTFPDPQGREVQAVAFGPEGKCIVSMNGDEIKVWNAEPRAAAATIELWLPKEGKLSAHQAQKQEWGWPTVSPDARWLVCSGMGEPKGRSHEASVQVWDLASHQQRFLLAHNNKQPPLGHAFSPDGRFFVLGGEDAARRVCIWETASWKTATGVIEPVKAFTNEFEAGCISFSPDGKVMALAGLAFEPVLRSGATNRLAFFEVGSWKRLNLFPGAGAGATETNGAATVAFSHNGRLLAVGYRDGWARLWDFQTQRLLYEAKRNKADGTFGVGVSFSNDSRWLASVTIGGLPPAVVLFDLADLKHVRPVLNTKGHEGNSWSAIFAPDSRSLITSGGDGLIKFWNLQTRREALILAHTPGLGVMLSIARNGNLLVSQDADGLVKLWPAAAFDQIPQWK